MKPFGVQENLLISFLVLSHFVTVQRLAGHEKTDGVD